MSTVLIQNFVATSMRQLFFICILFVSAIAHAQPNAHEKTILVLGDSLSAAYGINEEQGWVALLQKRLEEKGHAYRVVNASISGETTAGGASRADKLLAAHNPSLVIIELGANDGLRGLSIKAMKENLSSIITSAQQAQTDTILIGMKLPPNYGVAYTSMFERAYTDIATQLTVPLIPFFFANLQDDRHHFQSDDLHPTAAAQPLLLDTVWPQIEQNLTRNK